MKSYALGFIVLFLSYQQCKGQASFYLMNESLNRAYEDSNLLKGKIKNIKHYKLLTKDVDENNYNDTKEINHKTYYLVSNVDYTKAKAILRRSSHEIISKAKGYTAYYYDKNNNLKIIRSENEGNTDRNTNIFWYDDKNSLTEIFRYRTYLGNDFDYLSYDKLDYKYEKEGTFVSEFQYDYDTLASPVHNTFYNLKGKLIKSNGRITKDEFKNYKKGRKLMKRSLFYNNELLSQTLYDRDKKGYLIKKTYNKYKPNTYVNYETYTYENNYTEEIMQTYSNGFKNKESIHRKKVDLKGNIIKEGYIDRNGDGYYTHYKYKYDSKKNWIKKTRYYESIDKYKAAEKKLEGEEIRDISYYKKNEIVNFPEVPDINPKVFETKRLIPIWAKKKQKAIDEYNRAKESGEYDNTILIKSAKTIKEFTPKLWKVIIKVSGDLNGDDIDEVAIVYDTPIKNVEHGEERVLAVFKKKKNNWELWQQSKTAILPTGSGGVMGDGFETINIKNKCIVVSHFGGSRSKWSITTKYKYQDNDWFLVGYTDNSGSPCDFFSNTDYNLNTGKLISSFENGDCEENDGFDNEKKEDYNEIFFFKLKELPRMKTYKIFESTINIKSSGREIGF